ncbi:MAG: hypothetical protein MUF49_16870 [Oculatellaceae cyanobacterium Prado106]|nr:hypothetical protein [Oculatellaceae cyanobacterium Prado106]
MKSLRWLIRPALLLSVGLHVLLLLIPIPKNPTEVAQQQNQPETDAIPITQLPLQTVPPKPSPTPPSPKATPTVSPTPKVLVQASPLVPPVPPRVAAPPPVTAPAPAASPAIAPTPPATTPSPTAIATPTPTPSPSPSPQPSATPPSAFSNFPHLSGSQSGCFGLETCHQISDGSNFRIAAQTLEQQLESEGYAVRLRDDLEEAGRKVYEVSKQNETQYLSVISTDLGTTVYVLAAEPKRLQDLQAQMHS